MVRARPRQPQRHAGERPSHHARHEPQRHRSDPVRRRGSHSRVPAGPGRRPRWSRGTRAGRGPGDARSGSQGRRAQACRHHRADSHRSWAADEDAAHGGRRRLGVPDRGRRRVLLPGQQAGQGARTGSCRAAGEDRLHPAGVRARDGDAAGPGRGPGRRAQHLAARGGGPATAASRRPAHRQRRGGRCADAAAGRREPGAPVPAGRRAGRLPSHRRPQPAGGGDHLGGVRTGRGVHRHGVRRARRRHDAHEPARGGWRGGRPPPDEDGRAVRRLAPELARDPARGVGLGRPGPHQGGHQGRHPRREPQQPRRHTQAGRSRRAHRVPARHRPPDVG